MKRRMTPWLLALFATVTLYPSIAFGIDLECDIGQGTTSNAATVAVQEEGGADYLFLPSQVDLRNVMLGSGTSSEIQVWSNVSRSYEATSGQVDLVALGVADQEGNVAAAGSDLWVLLDGEQHRIRIMKSANVRSIFINADHDLSYIHSSASHSVSDTGNAVVFSPEGNVMFDADFSGIKGRGNTTWSGSDKKPYQLKLNKKADLLGTGEKTKTWLLLANAADPTLLRNTISYKLGLYLGSQGTPSCEPCDLYYNSEYRGSYLITEKVKAESNGVDIKDLDDANESANKGSSILNSPESHVSWDTNDRGHSFSYVNGLTSPEDISGGYLIELDDKANGEISTFYAGNHYFTLKTPEYATYEESKYVSELMAAGLNAASHGGKDQVSGKNLSEIFDYETLEATGLAQDFIQELDYLYSSSYFYIPEEQNRIFAGPIWDCDRSFNLSKSGATSSFAKEFLSGNDELFSLVGDAERKKLAPVVRNVLLGDVDAVTSDGSLHSVTYYKMQLAASQQMDETVWGIAPLRDDWISYDPVEGKTWSSYVDDLGTYMNARINYLDQFYAKDSWSYCEWRIDSARGWVPYIDGSPVLDGWVLDKGSWYLMIDGQLQTNGWTYSDGWYLFNSSGAMLTGWQSVDGSWYHLSASGRMDTGWTPVDGAWYWLDGSGAMRTGWVNLGTNWYYFDSSGAMQTGWFNDGSAWYYAKANGTMQTGWLRDGDTWYWLNNSGSMVTGWAPVGSSWYFFNGSGAMQTGWISSNGTWYLLNESGAMATGWNKAGNSWYLLSGSGAMLKGWQSINGTWYYLDANGAMAVGWRHIDGGWYYLDESGSMATGWRKVDGAWFYLDSNGAMHTGWLKTTSGWYYLMPSGNMATGTAQVDGINYFFDETGLLMSGNVSSKAVANNIPSIMDTPQADPAFHDDAASNASS